jgi:histidyl-tRNA synthetase
MALSKAPYKGTRDFFPAQMRLRNYMFSKMAEVSELFAYEPYDGPILEEIDLYRAKSGDELINEQVYSFTDRGDRQVAIRPEMTPTVARMAAQVHREIAKPIRWYAIPNLMRYEKPQRGRLREFWQYNADIFGAGAFGEIEILQLAVNIMKNFGATHEQFEVLINDRKLVNLVFNDLLKLDADVQKKLYKLIDNKKKMAPDKFESEAAILIPDAAKASIFKAYSSLATFADVKLFIAKYSQASTAESLPILVMFDFIEKLGLNNYIKFDPSIVRGLDYYTGIVFEIFDKHPENLRAIAGGGAYANLLQIFNEPALEGVGIGMGEVTLKDFLTTHNLLPDFTKTEVDVLIAYTVPEGEKEAFLLAEQMRSRGIKTEVLFSEAKMKKVFTYSEKKDFKFIAVFGEEEMKNRQVQIKDLTTKETQNVELHDMEKISRIFKGN